MSFLDDRLDALREQGLYRQLQAPDGVDLSSNDYLGLSRHPAVVQALTKALEAGVPAGSGGSRLLSGQHPLFDELERAFAAQVGAEASLFFSTGYAANVGLLSALPDEGDLVISDRLNHASLIDGLRLGRADKLIVPHNDVGAVESALVRAMGRRVFVVVESVYSMDGDMAPLEQLADLCMVHGAHLIVDEAHGGGIFGATGGGLVQELGLREKVFATIHPAGKALGMAGCFVAGSQALRELLINRARSFIFSTAPPPFLAAGLLKVLELLADPALDRTRPLKLADRLRGLVGGRLDLGASQTHIVPVMIGGAEEAVRVQQELQHRGWHARAIRPPTVPDGQCRLRLVMRSELSELQVEMLAMELVEVCGG